MGSGQGHNWWCVLFPPLCFVGAVSGKTEDLDLAQGATQDTPASGFVNNTDSVSNGGLSTGHSSLQINSKRQIHFYLWDKSREFYSWLKKEI